MKIDFNKCIKYGVEQAMEECELTIGMTLKEAVEKQIPKKPINTSDHHKHFCPACHQPIKLGRQYCGSCGQKIGYGSDTE